MKIKFNALHTALVLSSLVVSGFSASPVEIDLQKEQPKTYESAYIYDVFGLKKDLSSIGYVAYPLPITDGEANDHYLFAPAMQDLAPGLEVEQSASSSPGFSSWIRIRGDKRHNGFQDPAMVLNGFSLPFLKTEAHTTTSREYGPHYDMKDMVLYASDIEYANSINSIAETSKLGSSGSNAAIVLKLKSGRNQPKFSYTHTHVYDKPWDIIPKQNKFAQGAMGMTGPLLSKTGFSYGAPITGGEATSAEQDTTRLIDGETKKTAQTEYSFNDLNESYVFRTVWNTKDHLALAHSTDTMALYTSYNRTRQDGIVFNTGFNADAFLVNADLSPTNWFKTNIFAIYSDVSGNMVQDGANVSGLMLTYTRTSPNFHLKPYITSSGEQVAYRGIGTPNYNNPLFTIYETLAKAYEKHLIVGSITDIQHHGGTTTLALGFSSSKDQAYLYSRPGDRSTRGKGVDTNIDIYNEESILRVLRQDNWLTTPVHTLGSQVSLEHHVSVYSSSSISKDVVDSLGKPNLIQNFGKDEVSVHYQDSIVGELMHSYLGQFFTNMRITAEKIYPGYHKNTSDLAVGHTEPERVHYDFGYTVYPGIDMRYIPASLQNKESNYLSGLSLKASAGQAGNLKNRQQLGGLYDSSAQFIPTVVNYYNDTLQACTNYLVKSNLTNDRVLSYAIEGKKSHPAVTSQFDVGFDLHMIKDRAKLSFSYFYDETKIPGLTTTKSDINDRAGSIAFADLNALNVVKSETCSQVGANDSINLSSFIQTNALTGARSGTIIALPDVTEAELLDLYNGGVYLVNSPEGLNIYKVAYSKDATRLKNRGFELSSSIDWVKSKDFDLSTRVNLYSLVNTYHLGSSSEFRTDSEFIVGFTSTSISRAVDGSATSYRARSRPDGFDANGFPKTDATVAKNFGKLDPDWELSANVMARYKDFSASVLAEYSKGGIYGGTQTNSVLNFFGISKESGSTITLEKDLVNAAGMTFPAGSQVRGYVTDFGAGDVLVDASWWTDDGGGFGDRKDHMVHDATYGRIKELSLSYNTSLVKLGVTSLGSHANIKITATLNDWWNWNKHAESYVNTDTSLHIGKLQGGLEYFNTPSRKSGSVSVRVTF